MSRVGKKAQITIFIIIGIFVVVGTSAVILFQDSSLRDSLTETESGLVQQRVGTDFEPVQRFVTACMETVARDAVERLALHGGYVDSSTLRANRIDPTSHSANSIYFWPGNEDYKIAYWWHLKSHPECFWSSSCEFGSNTPPLTGNHPLAVDSQIANYVDENLERCISDFRGFINQGYEFDIRDGPSTEVIIAENDLVVSMKYPVEVAFGGRSELMDIFNSRLDVDLRNLWEIALNITNNQAINAFLELQLLEIISVYSGSGPNAILPPSYTDLRGRYSDRRFSWTRTEIRQALQSMLASYVPMFSVMESRNFRFSGFNDDFDMAIFERMIMSISRIDQKNRYDVSFDYKNWWDIYLQIGDSEMITPKSSVQDGIGKIPFLGPMLKELSPIEYRFTYDVSYPVLVTIRDVEAFGNDGLVMNFALESNVRSNMPVSPGANEFDSSLVPSALSSERFCDGANLNSEPVRIKVRDSFTNEPVSRVSLEYTCGPDNCFLGTTESHSDGIYFEGKFPACLGGLLEISSRDYGSKYVEISLEPGEEVELPDFYIHPIVELDAEIKVFGNVKMGGSWGINFANPIDLRPEESVLLNVQRVTDGLDDFSSIAYFSGDNNVTLKLVPGEYTVSGQLTLDTSGDNLEDVVIPEKEEETDGIFGTSIGSETYTLPKIEFGDIFPQGILFLDDDHGGNWIVTSEDLERGKVTFYIIASPYIPYGGVNLNHNDLNEFGKSDFYSRRFRDDIEPCFGDAC